MTDSTAPAQQQGRSVPVQAILERYQQQLANATHELFVAQAHLAVLEQENGDLRLRVIELEQPQPAGKE